LKDIIYLSLNSQNNWMIIPGKFNLKLLKNKISKIKNEVSIKNGIEFGGILFMRNKWL
jgi:hypothetical protein